MPELPEKSDTKKVEQSNALVNRMAQVRLPEPTTPASWPVKVSVPCPTVRPVLQSMIVVKSATDTPVKLPL